MVSPASRRSPRLKKQGLHATPPANDIARQAETETRKGVVSCSSLDQSTSAININGQKMDCVKTPTSGQVVPLSSTATPNRTGRAHSQLESSLVRISPNKNAAARGQTTTRQSRRAVVSPRTRGSALVSILASPGDMDANNNGRRRHISPKSRSSAGATLHYLARAVKRKAATAANDQVRSICEMGVFDDLNLDDQPEISQKPSENSNRGPRNAVSDSVDGGKIQSTSSSSRNGEEHPVTIDTFIPKGKHEEMWLLNFKKWTRSQHDSLTTGSSGTSSPLPKYWVRRQRMQYRLLQQNKQSTMTQSKISLLESAGFCWRMRNSKITTKTDSKQPAQSNTFVPKGKREEMWFRNFKQWTRSQQDSMPTRSVVNSSPRSKEWVRLQRKNYQLLHQNKKTTITQDKISLLESAGFRWRGNSKLTTKTDSKQPVQSNGSSKNEEANKSTNESLPKRKSTRTSFPPQYCHELDKSFSGSDAETKIQVDSEQTSKRTNKRSNESLTKKKSARESFPTQFCHNLQTSSSNKEGDSGARKSASSPSIEAKKQSQTIQSTESSTRTSKATARKRKSPRERFSTQFYHNIQTSSSKKETSRGASKCGSIQTKKAEKQAQIMSSPKSSAHATTSKSKNDKKLLTSESRTTLTPNESLWSLPSGATKKKSDKQKQSKKKKRRGRLSTSSLSALELPTETLSKDGKCDDIKGSVSFSHKELQRQLSKTKRKPARKKPGIGVAKKKSESNTTDSFNGVADGRAVEYKKETTADMHNNDASPLLPDSRTAELMPSLSESNHAQHKILEPDSADKSTTDLSGVRITELLLSCLSGESSEKDDLHAGSISRSKMKTQCLSNTSHGTPPGSPPLSSKSNLLGKFLSANPPNGGAGASNTAVESLVHEPHEKGTGNLLRTSTSDVIAGVNNTPISIPEKHSSVLKGHSSDQPASLQKEKVSTPLDPPPTPNNEPINSWTCDVCQEATFQKHDEAMAHERECSARSYTQGEASLSKKEGEASASKQRENNALVKASEMPASKFKCDKSIVEQPALSQKKTNNNHMNGWTCEGATNENYDGAMTRERDYSSISHSQDKAPFSKIGEADGFKKRESNPVDEDSNVPASKSKSHKSNISSVTKGSFAKQPISPQKDSIDKRTNCWTCDTCQVKLSNDGEENPDASQKRENNPTVAELEKPTTKAKRHKSTSPSSINGNFAHQTQKGSASSVPRSSSTRNVEPSIHPAGIDATTQAKPPSSTSNNQGTHSLPILPAAMASGQAPNAVGHQYTPQPTSVPNRDLINEFSPLSFTSPLRADSLLEHSNIGDDRGTQDTSAKSTGNVSLIPFQLNPASRIQPARLVPANITEMSSQLANSSRDLVSTGLPSGAKASESQVQMIMAEKKYQQRMAELYRLELEARMVTERMREIEGEINGLDVNTASYGIADPNRVGGSESALHSESKYLSMQRSYSRSDQYKSSEERKYSDEYYAQSGRRRRRETSSGKTESNVFSEKKLSRRSEEDTHERSAKRVKVRSRSSRQQESRNFRSSYADAEVHIESSSSRRSKKVDLRRIERFVSGKKGEQRKRHDHSPGATKRSKGCGSTRKPAFSKERPRQATNSVKPSRSEQNKKSLDEAPRKRAAHRRPAEDRGEQKESRPRSRKHSGKSRDPRREERDRESERLPDERSTPRTSSDIKSIVAPMNELSAADEGFGTAVAKPQAEVKGCNDKADDKESLTVILDAKKLGNDNNGTTQQHEPQVHPTRDPLYWLAGGGNSSDDESWDFDGPMILPPPPI